MKHLARWGCLARSAVYFMIGVMALLVAMGSSHGVTTDESGILRQLADQPFGRFILLVLAVGLFSYAIWRVAQAIQDHDHYGRSVSGIGMRIAFFTSGAAYFFLGGYALNLVFSFTKQTRWGERMMARWMLLQPFGRYFLGAIAIGVIVTGFLQFLRAGSGSFTRDLFLPAIGASWMRAICRLGLVSRGVIFVIIGCFLLQAAWKIRSREAGGVHQALEALRQQPGGNYLVGAVALGFIAFAGFGLIEGFYRKRSGD